jgi:hypothetical protein
LKKYLTDHLLNLRLLAPPMRKGATWPAYRYIKPDKEWWKHLETWRSAVVLDVAEVALAFDSAIAAAVATIPRA